MAALSTTQLRTLALSVVDPIVVFAGPVHSISGKIVRQATFDRLVSADLLVDDKNGWVPSELGLQALDRAVDDGSMPDGVLEQQVTSVVKQHLRTIRPVR